MTTEKDASLSTVNTNFEENLAVLEDDLQTLMEFMRIKSPELHTRQSQLARAIFVYLVLNIVLFLIIFDTVGSISLDLNQPLDSLGSPRPYVIFGMMLIISFYFMRFGYLYYQGTKDIVSVHNVIGKVLPLTKIRPLEERGGTYLRDLREALMQQCKSNYIVQSLVVFLYPPSDIGDIRFEDGPLSGSNPLRAGIIKLLMIGMIICFGWLIAVSQLMVLISFLAFDQWFIATLAFCTFTCYYLFYFEYVYRAASKLKDKWIIGLTVIVAVIIGGSSAANLMLLANYDKAAPVFGCRIDRGKLAEVSPPARGFVGFVLAHKGSERGIPFCAVGFTR